MNRKNAKKHDTPRGMRERVKEKAWEMARREVGEEADRTEGVSRREQALPSQMSAP